MNSNRISTRWTILLFLFGFGTLYGQNPNPYALDLITEIGQLEKSIKENPDKAMVHLKDYAPTIVLDIKYATNQNVFYTQLYEKPRAFIRLPVAKALAAVQQELNGKGYGLKIYDAYRPYSVTYKMFEMLPDTLYMGLPWQGSKHNRGVALDLTLIDMNTKQELKMPTPYDALVYPSQPEFAQLPQKVIKNRELLKSAMQKHGFVVDPMEWWHFNYVSDTKFELMDIPLEELNKVVTKRKKK